MKNYKDLLVWQKAHKLVFDVYKISNKYPSGERYNLTRQVRRAAISIPTNIAEGCGKLTQPDFAKYLQDAFGSTQEVEYLSFLSFELSYLKREDYDKLDKKINEVKAMLISLIKKVRTDLK